MTKKTAVTPAPDEEPTPKSIEQGPVGELVPVEQSQTYDIGEADAGMTAIAKLSNEEFAERLALARTAVDRINAIVQSLLVDGTDYGTVPGVKKPFLFQEGATQLCRVFKFVPVYTRKVTYGTPPETPAATVETTCDLHLGTADGPIVGSAGGLCTTHESRYRYRIAKRTCPNCGEPTIQKSKFKPEYYCYAKLGGCGEVFGLNDPRILEQVLGLVDNPDPLDQLETILQVADKRALVMAVRRATGAGRLFTQDEDVVEAAGGRSSAEPQDERKEATPTQKTGKPAPAQPGPVHASKPGPVEPARKPKATPKTAPAVGWHRLIPDASELAFLEQLLVAEAENPAGDIARVFTEPERQKTMVYVSSIRYGGIDEKTGIQVTEQTAVDTFRRLIVRTVTEFHRRSGTRYSKPVPGTISTAAIELLEHEDETGAD